MRILPLSSRRIARLSRKYSKDLNLIELRKSVKVMSANVFSKNEEQKQFALKSIA